MGVHVHVRLIAERVPEPVWERIYQDSLRLLRGWPDPPLGIGCRQVAGVRVTAYTREYERAQGWSVVGDASSRRVAEPFELPARLRIEEGFGDLERDAAGDASEALALRALAEEDSGKPSKLSHLFGSKTLGRPYHTLIVAVATLIENRLPGVALACGNFDTEDAERAREELARIFGEPFELPVLLEPARIRTRAPDLDAEGLSIRHTDQLAPGTAALYRSVLKRMRIKFLEELESKELVCTDLNQFCEVTRMAYSLLGIGLRDLTVQSPPTPVGEEPARILLGAIAEGVTAQNITLTDMAWDSIESADEDTWRFLLLLCQVKCDHLHMHQTLLAIYENPTLRVYVMDCWSGELVSSCGAALRTAERTS